MAPFLIGLGVGVVLTLTFQGWLLYRAVTAPDVPVDDYGNP